MKADLRHSRHVRITLEGFVGAARGTVLPLRFGGENGPLLLVDQDWPGVTVQDVVAPRTWSVGDIVAGEYPYRRGADGRWRGVVSHMVVTFSDAELDDMLADPDSGMDVLRYQAGEQ